MHTIFLYVKTHSKTGLKYFGKTTQQDPHKYSGSGVYWRNHLKKHGAEYTTEIIAQFDDEAACQEFALAFSKHHDIVASTEWANLQEENGIDGAPKGHKGHKFTQEQLQKISESSKERWTDPVYRQKVVESQTARWTEQRKQCQSNRMLGTSRPDHSEKLRGRQLLPNHPFFDGTKSEEHKQNISKALAGRRKSAAHKQHLSEAIQNRTQEEWKQILENRRLKSKPKFEIDGIPYVSLSEASEKLGITPFFVKKRITRHFESDTDSISP